VPGGGGQLRRLELRVRATDADGKELLSGRRLYQFSYYTAAGVPTSGTDPEAVRWVDTTVRAGEKRIERFPLPVDRAPSGVAPAKVTAELLYWYVNPEIQERNGLKLDAATGGPQLVRERSAVPAVRSDGIAAETADGSGASSRSGKGA
jgi:hypothetical protein